VAELDDPFTAMGGGVRLADGGWVPKDHPLAQQAGAQPAAAAPTNTNTGTAGASGGNPAGNPSLQQQAAGAQTVSNAPGAAPTAQTANQGTQDVVRNSWLQQATQPTTVDTNDPNFRQQADTFAAAQERSRRNAVADQAESFSTAGMGGSGAQSTEARMATERAGQATGAFESQLIAKELQNKRDEIKNALSSMGDMISNDQKNALTMKLAELDAALKREGIDATSGLGYAELGLKDRLGTAANNNDLMRMMLQNQQFGQGQALNWSQFDWDTNPMNPQNYGGF
jgi:hypothetical protein